MKLEKIQKGYYMKARIIQESKIMRCPPYVREIWDWLLMNANHRDVKYGKHIVQRGQLFRSYKDIREGLAWYIGWKKCTYNENHTKKAMKALREALMIATRKELGGVLITIVNYNLYQDPGSYESTNESTNESTSQEPLLNQPIPYNNKNVKNVEECKKKKDKDKDKSSTHLKSPKLKKQKKEIENLENKKQVLDHFESYIKGNPVLLRNHKNNYAKNIEACDKLVEIDGHTPSQIRDSIDKAMSHKRSKGGFSWKDQFRSFAKLRNKDKEGVPYIVIFSALDSSNLPFARKDYSERPVFVQKDYSIGLPGSKQKKEML